MKRRTFLKLTGLGSISFAAGCSPEPSKTLYSLVQAPEDTVTGQATWYASTCRECPAGCGVLAKNREGRVIKLEGNPLHPINQGSLCLRGQAALQGIYNPDRLTMPRIKDGGGFQLIGWEEARKRLQEALQTATQSDGTHVRLLSEVVGATQARLFAEAMEALNGAPPLFYEAFAYENLRFANQEVFGFAGLPAYGLERADLLLSFGADFLETWLSPVEYARKFKEMHGVYGHAKGRFVAVAPFRGLTSANADEWLGCHPGGEAAVALGLVHAALSQGRGLELPAELRDSLAHLLTGYTMSRVSDLSGIPQARLAALKEALLAARRPLILGSGVTNGTLNGRQTDMAANLLNWILDPDLRRVDFTRPHRVAAAAPRSDLEAFWSDLAAGQGRVLLLNNTNPAYSMPPAADIPSILQRDDLFVVSFSNFMDETSQWADLVLPVKMALETWDEYGGHPGITSLLQPAMGHLYDLPSLGDLLLACAFTGQPPAADYKQYLLKNLSALTGINREREWIQGLRQGGFFPERSSAATHQPRPSKNFTDLFLALDPPQTDGLALMAAPSIRFHDGRGANRPWLAEIPDPVTRIAWQTPLWVHPDTLAQRSLVQGDTVRVTVDNREEEAPVYATRGTRPNVVVMPTGQGHTAFGRYAKGHGANPFRLMESGTQIGSGAPALAAPAVTLKPAGRTVALARVDGSRSQHERAIALSMPAASNIHGADHHDAHTPGLAMEGYPLALPLAEGYRRDRDFYPPHDHDTYRWAMTVDLDRCIGCGACVAACYAENNIGIAGEARIAEGREMAWLSIDRYHDRTRPGQLVFIPMLCQHCDNAPCESVCPVYAPHHNKEGMNNQIYNRCIGTRFCSQNCPYKVRRFNWFAWDWPGALKLQLNPNVTVRAKGVMEKCSFCVQRIKTARSAAKNEKRLIRDGEVVPACVQTCPTEALTFGNLMDPQSRVRKNCDDPRAYQVMGYLNTKPAVIYLKKVIYKI